MCLADFGQTVMAAGQCGDTAPRLGTASCNAAKTAGDIVSSPTCPAGPALAGSPRRPLAHATGNDISRSASASSPRGRLMPASGRIPISTSDRASRFCGCARQEDCQRGALGQLNWPAEPATRSPRRRGRVASVLQMLGAQVVVRRPSFLPALPFGSSRAWDFVNKAPPAPIAHDSLIIGFRHAASMAAVGFV